MNFKDCCVYICENGTVEGTVTNEMEAEKIITYIVGIGNRLIRLKGACEKRNCLNNV